VYGVVEVYNSIMYVSC